MCFLPECWCFQWMWLTRTINLTDTRVSVFLFRSINLLHFPVDAVTQSNLKSVSTHLKWQDSVLFSKSRWWMLSDSLPRGGALDWAVSLPLSLSFLPHCCSADWLCMDSAVVIEKAHCHSDVFFCVIFMQHTHTRSEQTF